MPEQPKDNETESLRAERGEQPADDALPLAPRLTIGGMARGPVGREGAEDDARASDGAEGGADAEEARRREQP